MFSVDIFGSLVGNEEGGYFINFGSGLGGWGVSGLPAAVFPKEGRCRFFFHALLYPLGSFGQQQYDY